TDTDTDTDTGATEASFDDVQDVLDANCTGCHGSKSPYYGNLDLSTDACENLVGADAYGYTGEYRVVAGDSGASVIWHKMSDSESFGGVMPTTGALDSDMVDLVAEWIDAGASCD
ncbi:MAG: hypothetical protein QGG40_22605, partial [Myxococcota bacterium]|nr:hypothetical protein [Myxococcota bacterium]